MVARITVPHSIERALNYNEKKMQEGIAECIHAHNYLKEAGQLNYYEKLQRFQQLISLNDRANTNTIHISLNFDIAEKLEKEKLAEIAVVYMQKIGFAEQPFLVYQHKDAGHPHIHIISTNIQKNGKRISMHNIGRNQSTQARKEIEIMYQLVQAENHKVNEEIKSLNVQRVIYGKSETKRGITNVLNEIINKYKYTSLAELNAILRMYNVTADRGNEQGIIYRKHGLVYRILDDKGNKIGMPVKASSIYNKPTLKYLEQKFTSNETLRQGDKKKLKTSIDWIMVKPPKNLQQFKDVLQKEKISLIIRQNNNGIIYGLTYIDHTTKSVFNGSDIGKEYSSKAILEKCGQSQSFPLQETIRDKKVSVKKIDPTPLDRTHNLRNDIGKTLDIIINPTENFSNVPYELRKQKKKKVKSHN
jgi:hypothetical protein